MTRGGQERAEEQRLASQGQAAARIVADMYATADPYDERYDTGSYEYSELRLTYHAAPQAAGAVLRSNRDYQYDYNPDAGFPGKGDPFKRLPYPVKTACFGDRDSDSEWYISTKYLKATKSVGNFDYLRDMGKGDYTMDWNREFETLLFSIPPQFIIGD
eukprot:IDg9425t1